jgi:riboflavin biosynthesis pyrimidine reductase
VGMLKIEGLSFRYPGGDEVGLASRVHLSPRFDRRVRLYDAWALGTSGVTPIAVETSDGTTVLLEDGGAKLILNGEEQNDDGPGEYPDIYRTFADLIDDVKKIVFSKTLKEVNWKNTMLVDEINKDAISKLKEESEPGKNIIIWGSPGFVSELTKLGLIDEYHFLIHPMIPGNGKRFFENIKMDNQQETKLYFQYKNSILRDYT